MCKFSKDIVIIFQFQNKRKNLKNVPKHNFLFLAAFASVKAKLIVIDSQRSL